MNAYAVEVIVYADNIIDADKILTERLAHDEDLRDEGIGDYGIEWGELAHCESEVTI